MNEEQKNDWIADTLVNCYDWAGDDGYPIPNVSEYAIAHLMGQDKTLDQTRLKNLFVEYEKIPLLDRFDVDGIAFVEDNY